MPGNVCKSFDVPVLGFPDRSGHQDRDRFAAETTRPKQLVDLGYGALGLVDPEIRRVVIEAEHRPEPEISVHRMDIEGGQANPVGIRQPGSLAGPGPSMFAGYKGGVFSLGRLELPAGPVKSDADGRAGGQCEYRGPELAVEVDDQVVMHPPEVEEQSNRTGRCRPAPAELREFMAREEDHVRKVGMMADQVGIFRRDQPIDARVGIAGAELDQDRQRVNDISQGRGLDEEDPPEFLRRDVGHLPWDRDVNDFPETSAFAVRKPTLIVA